MHCEVQNVKCSVKCAVYSMQFEMCSMQFWVSSASAAYISIALPLQLHWKLLIYNLEGEASLLFATENSIYFLGGVVKYTVIVHKSNSTHIQTVSVR